MLRKQTFIVAVLALLSSPVALANWGMMGSSEPDTKHDVAGGWMFTTADITTSQAVRKVYFNGYYGQCINGTCEGLNPNVATVRTGIHNAEYIEKALLGVWKDCNKDGFVGLGDQGLFEYRSELLLDTSVCPKQPPIAPDRGVGNIYYSGTAMPPHNDGTWVNEFIPIGWYDSTAIHYDNDPYNIDDQGARVWVDHGLEPSYQIGCYYTSFPTGTFRSTGGLIHTEDCIDSYHATDAFDTVADSNANTQPLSFSDKPRDQANSASTLNQANPWGNERTDGSYVHAWDCSKPQTHVVGSKTRDGALVSYRDDTTVNVSAPRVPPTTSSSGSAAGTLNETGAGLDACARNTNRDGNTHWGDTTGGLAYSQESGTFESAVRTSPDQSMRPIERQRPPAPYAVIPGYGKSGPAGDAGVHWLESDCHNAGDCGEDGVWTGNRVWHQETIYTSPGTSPIAKVTFETYYAFVSPAAVTTYGLTLPKGGATAIYGQEACGAFAFTGIHNGWDCDKTHWYKDTQGTDVAPRWHYLGPDPNAPPGTICVEYSQLADINGGCLPYGSLPGDLYNMQDIDCYDQSVQSARALGVSYGTLSGTQCDWTP